MIKNCNEKNPFLKTVIIDDNDQRLSCEELENLLILENSKIMKKRIKKNGEYLDKLVSKKLMSKQDAIEDTNNFISMIQEDCPGKGNFKYVDDSICEELMKITEEVYNKLKK